MGFFTKPEATDAGLAPLTAARIKTALDSQGWRYTVDDDGEINGGWDDGYFYFLQRGKEDEILYVRGIWYIKLTAADLAAARAACDEWNESTLWPKAYTVTLEGDVVRVAAEHAMDYEHGVSDAQLGQHLRIAVATGCAFFEKLNETFPEQTAAQKDE